MDDTEIEDDIPEVEDDVEVQPEGETEVEAEEDEAQAADSEEQPKRRGRAADTIGELRRERRAERERADDLERQLAALREDFNRTQKEKDQRAYEERMANLTPEERMYAELQDTKRQIDELTQKQTRELKNHQDRLSFEALVAKEPKLKSIVPQVEQEHAALQRQFGLDFPRQIIAAALIGLPQLQAIENGQKKKAADEGKKRIERQRTSPGGGGSDVRRGGSKPDPNSPEARRARLENAVF